MSKGLQIIPAAEPTCTVFDRRHIYTTVTTALPVEASSDDEEQQQDIELYGLALGPTNIIHEDVVVSKDDVVVDAMVVPENVDSLVPPHDEAQDAVELPKSFTYHKNDDNETVIAYKWSTTYCQYIWLCVLMFFAILYMFFVILFVAGMGLWSIVLPPTWGCIASVVFIVHFWFNSTIISITPTQVTVKVRPFGRIYGTQSFSLSPETVQEIRCKKHVSHNSDTNSTTVWYEVHIVRRRNEGEPWQATPLYDTVISKLGLAEQALFIKQEIERVMSTPRPTTKMETYPSSYLSKVV